MVSFMVPLIVLFMVLFMVSFIVARLKIHVRILTSHTSRPPCTYGGHARDGWSRSDDHNQHKKRTTYILGMDHMMVVYPWVMTCLPEGVTLATFGFVSLGDYFTT